MNQPIKCFLLDHGYEIKSGGPCCYVSVGNVKNFTELHTNKRFIQIKSLMDSGQWAPECRACRVKEDLTGQAVSLRQHSNMSFNNAISNGGLKYLVVDTGNLCNLQCRSCNHLSSSSWVNETDVLKNYLHQKRYHHQIVDRIIFIDGQLSGEYLPEDDYSQLTYLGIRGGEPLYMPATLDLIEKISQHDVSQCTVHITTNGTILLDLKKYQWMKKFNTVAITLSMDATDQAAEFIRTGCKWSTVYKNLLKYSAIAKEESNIHLTYHPTYSILNIFEIPKLYSTMESLNIALSNELNVLQTPSFLSFSVLTDRERINVIEFLTDYNLTNLVDYIIKINHDPGSRALFFDYMEHTKQYHQMDWAEYLPDLYNLIAHDQ